jgi:hypothetical protein
MRFPVPRAAATGAVLALGLTGCQTGPTLAQRLHAYVGQPESVIVQGLGVPNRSITTGGIKYLAYDWQSTQIMPGAPVFTGWGWGPYGGWGGGFYGAPAIITLGCEATFQMGPGDVAVAVVFRGNNCG